MTSQETPEQLLSALRHRADEDFISPPPDHTPGRHTVDCAELGLRVSVTRSRYPNRPDGIDQYAVTITRIAVDGPPGEPEVRHALEAAFGTAAAATAVARPGGPAVRMFRVMAGAGD